MPDHQESAEIRAIIADDQLSAREFLRRALESVPGVAVVAECADGAAVRNIVLRGGVDVLFLDVELPDASAFSVIRDLRPCPAVVFVTNRIDCAVEAFALEAVDYLLKPVSPRRLHEALGRVRRGREPLVPYAERFVVAARGRLVVIPAEELRYAQAAANYVQLHGAGTRALLRDTMSAVERRLDPRQFVRVHRSFVVNMSYVRELRLLPTGDYAVVLSDQTSVPMSRNYRDTVVNRLRGSVG